MATGSGAVANMAVVLDWIPESLYNMSISTAVAHYRNNHTDIKMLPDTVKFDIYYEVSAVGK